MAALWGQSARFYFRRFGWTRDGLSLDALRCRRLGVQLVHHSLCDRETAFFARAPFRATTHYRKEREPRRGDEVFQSYFEPRMRLMQHPAASTLARDANEAGAIGALRIDFVVCDRVGRVPNVISRAPQPRRHFGFL